MYWLPIIQRFRDELRAADAAIDAQKRLHHLSSLAAHRLGLVEMLQLDRALSKSAAMDIDGFVRLRVAVLGSATLDHLAPAIRVAALRHRLLVDVHTGAYGQYRQEILDPASSLYAFGPQAIVLAVTTSDAIGNIPVTATEADVSAALAHVVDELRALWRALRDRAKVTVIQQTFLDHSLPVFGSYDRSVTGAPSRMARQLNDLLADAARDDGILLLDIEQQKQRDGIEAWFDVRRWLQAKQEIRPEAAALYGELLARIIAAQRGLSRKCLVLDLDNTLWGGVIGDDGVDGIVLGEGSAQGEAHLALQRYARQLKDRGILLAVCSKNDPAIAEAAFRDHPEMLLRRADIAAFVANWRDKAANLVEIAAQLNIGIDSLVFVDDNPVERARVREALPMVAVPELPDDPAEYAKALAAAGYFEAVGFTSEDRARAELYAKDSQRSALLSASTSVDDFLRSLDMTMEHGQFGSNDLIRVTQLVNKTNQFNTTTRRYSAEDIAAAASSPAHITLQFRLRDRFGDNGLVSTIILGPNHEPATYELENWVMSCRVFSRELEFEAMNIAVETALRRNARGFFADYIPTKKNVVIKDLFPSLGFGLVSGGTKPDESSRWFLDLSRYAPRQTHIARRETA
jgi:FkbH-like protein